jgi:hypothetical protein
MDPLPSSMIPELAAWNNGEGISLDNWIACEGSFKFAVGYSTLYWPKFILFEDYILQENFTVESVRGFEKQSNGDKRSVECILNHLHIADTHHPFCEDISADKIVFLGQILKEIWEAKLRWQFPDRPCVVDFYQPEDKSNLVEFQLTFWQKKHEKKI